MQLEQYTHCRRSGHIHVHVSTCASELDHDSDLLKVRVGVINHPADVQKLVYEDNCDKSMKHNSLLITEHILKLVSGESSSTGYHVIPILDWNGFTGLVGHHGRMLPTSVSKCYSCRMDTFIQAMDIVNRLRVVPVLDRTIYQQYIGQERCGSRTQIYARSSVIIRARTPHACSRPRHTPDIELTW